MVEDNRTMMRGMQESGITSQTLYRWTAAALIISGVSLAVGLFLHPIQPLTGSIATSQWAVSHFFWWLGALSGIIGILGLYLRQRDEIGFLGFSGSVLAVLGLVLIASAMYFEAFIAPSLAARRPELFQAYPTGGGWIGFLISVIASGLLFGVGLLMLGIAMIRARTVDRLPVLLAIMGGLPFAVNFLLPRIAAMLAVVVFGVGLVWLGYWLWKGVES